MEMLVQVLRQRAEVLEIRSFSRLVRFLLRCPLKAASARVLIYTSLMAPFIASLKLVNPTIPVFYMVRGDEVTYVRQRGRRIRSMMALVLQKVLVLLRCHFVFVCEDLRVIFEERLGHIQHSAVLPNTLGTPLPRIRQFDRTVALIGHFGSVKNVEWAIDNLSSGRFAVHLFGNYTHPEEWQRPWLQSHGFVADLSDELRRSCTLVILSYVDAGFPNVVLDALKAGCGIVVHDRFPFRYMPIDEAWRFSMAHDSEERRRTTSGGSATSDLEQLLERLFREQRNFNADNAELLQLIESSWEERVWDILG